jgi:hypothetical protein
VVTPHNPDLKDTLLFPLDLVRRIKTLVAGCENFDLLQERCGGKDDDAASVRRDFGGYSGKKVADRLRGMAVRDDGALLSAASDGRPALPYLPLEFAVVAIYSAALTVYSSAHSRQAGLVPREGVHQLLAVTYRSSSGSEGAKRGALSTYTIDRVLSQHAIAVGVASESEVADGATIGATPAAASAAALSSSYPINIPLCNFKSSMQPLHAVLLRWKLRPLDTLT